MTIKGTALAFVAMLSLTGNVQAAEVKALVAFFATSEAAAVMRAKGLEPGGG